MRRTTPCRHRQNRPPRLARLRAFAFALASLFVAAACRQTQGTTPPFDAGVARRDATATRDAYAEGADAGTEESSALRLGAMWNDDATSVTFRIASRNATRIALYVYAAPLGAQERLVRELVRVDATTWEAVVSRAELDAAGVGEAIYYGYRAWGPNWPFDDAWRPGSAAGFVADVDREGHRFNPNKLLLDPYALEISHDPSGEGRRDGSVFATGPSHRARDSAPMAPKAIVVSPQPAEAPGPLRAMRDDVVYEVHVRGFTMRDATVAEGCRGTYAGAAEKAAYLAELGVTVIELLPILETNNDQNDLEPSSAAGDNYWGYSTLGFFAPDRRYACDRSPGGPTRELREMIRAFHAHGIKVWLDVVYNHTAEGGTWNASGDTATILSLRGVDNASYYELQGDRRFYVDNNGVGPNVATASPLAGRLIRDSLHYLHDELGVDGFRFDLAPVLGNTCTERCFSFRADAADNLLQRIARELPARAPAGGAGVDLVAEPWAIGTGTYQLGAFPRGWAEWNGKFRDFVRMLLNEPGAREVTPGWLSARLAGSAELFADDDRSPAASVNYVSAHDGLTLRDVFACNGKRNDQPWPYGPSSGGDDENHASDQGGRPAAQRQAVRTALALTMLAQGVPMIVGGDERYRTQRCNNNGYNLDSLASWVPWQDTPDPSDEPGALAHFETFARRIIQFRRSHACLRRGAFMHGADGDGDDVADVTWLTATGARAEGAYLDDASRRFLAWRLDASERGEADDEVRSILVAYAGDDATTRFTLPAPAASAAWYRIADTAEWMEPEDNIAAHGSEALIHGRVYDLHAKSLVLFVER